MREGGRTPMRTRSRARTPIVGVALFLVAWAAALAQGVRARDVAQARNTLVLAPSDAVESSHSKFIGMLKEKAAGFGGTVDVKRTTDPDVKLKDWGTWLYDSLVLIDPAATSLGEGEDLVRSIVDFVDEGFAAIVVGGPGLSNEVRSLAAECGVVFSRDPAVDHFHGGAGGAGGGPGTLLATRYEGGSAVFSDGTVAKPLLWAGLGQHIDANNGLAFPAVGAHSTTYSAPKGGAMGKKGLKFSGETMALVSLMQGRNNARVAFLGSTLMCR